MFKILYIYSILCVSFLTRGFTATLLQQWQSDKLIHNTDKYLLKENETKKKKNPAKQATKADIIPDPKRNIYYKHLNTHFTMPC